MFVFLIPRGILCLKVKTKRLACGLGVLPFSLMEILDNCQSMQAKIACVLPRLATILEFSWVVRGKVKLQLNHLF